MKVKVALTSLWCLTQVWGCSGRAGSININHNYNDASICPTKTTLCSNECVDLLIDPDHCGECDNACKPNEVCFSGDCVRSCPDGFEECDGGCVDVSTDPLNCGGCGVTCPTEGTCENGDCVVQLSGDLFGSYEYPNSTVVIDGNIGVGGYNGTDDVSECDAGETGCLRIEAKAIVVNVGAVIDAAGKGYGGGGGGGGGPGNAGSSMNCGGGCTSCTVGMGGQGSSGGLNGANGSLGQGRSSSGGGGSGGGQFGGAGGAGVVSIDNDGAVAGRNGQAGGYAAAGGNGDNTTDESVRMGSGGGGGSGGACAYEPFYNSVGGSGGGGAGNSGGGYIKLVASERIVMGGTLLTVGLADVTGDGQNGSDGYHNDWPCDLEGSGGDGGHASASGSSSGGDGVDGYFRSGYNSCIDRQCEDQGSGAVRGGNGGDGGPGAGGGVIVKAPTVELGGTIDARGGRSATNGGTVKIFYQGVEPSTTGVTAGRVLVQAY